MGRIFETRKDRMFARWSKLSKAFTKIGREIAIAVKLGGPDTQTNPRLRMAIQNAKSANMPKDRVESAIKKASSRDETGMDEICYEGYGPHGIAVFVETATNNNTRTVANVRNIFNKYGGNLATTGALDFVFSRQGVFKISKPEIDLEEFELSLIDHGLEELFETEEGDLLIYTSFQSFGDIQHYLESQKIEVKNAVLQRSPQSTIELSAEQATDLNKLVDKLEDDEDVQQVYHNMKNDSSE